MEQEEHESKALRAKRGTDILASNGELTLLAVTTAVNWYVEHLAPTNIPIIFLSSEPQTFAPVRFCDQDQSSSLTADSRSLQGNVRVMTMATYLEQFFPTHPELRELCESLQSVVLEENNSIKADDDTNAAIVRHAQTGYFEVRSVVKVSQLSAYVSTNSVDAQYLSESLLDAGVKSGRFFKGPLYVNEHNGREAFVHLSEKTSLSKDIFIAGHVRTLLVSASCLAHTHPVTAEPQQSHPRRPGRGRAAA